MAEIITIQLNEDVAKVEEVQKHLRTLYNDPEFSTLFNRPVLSLLDAGCDYLIVNIRILATKFELRKKG